MTDRRALPVKRERGRNRRRHMAVGALVLGAVAALGVALRSTPPAEAAATATPERAATTPLWSARRWPGPAIALARATQVRTAVTAGMSGWDGCATVAVDGMTLAAERAGEPFVPGSTQKLFTAAAALRAIGPDARYETKALIAGTARPGAVDALYIEGGGDPLLQTDDYTAWKESEPTLAGNVHTSLEAFADSIVKAGITRVSRLIGDDSRYSHERTLSAWLPSDRANGEIGPLGALTVNAGFTQFGGGTKVPAADPTLLMLTRLRGLLLARGVTVDGPTISGVVPPDAKVVATASSPTMRDVVAEFLRASDNTTAELVLLEVGHHATNRDGTTTADALPAMRAQLSEGGVPTAGLLLMDGSGLARANRATCAGLVAVLSAAGPSLFDALAVAGTSGTLVAAMRGTAVEGRLHAKTGTLRGVSGLAGTFDSPKGASFSVLMNGGFTQAGGIAQRNRMAVIIGDALIVADPTAVVPVPGRSAPSP